MEQQIHQIEEIIVLKQEEQKLESVPVEASVSEKRAIIAAKIEALREAQGMQNSSDGSHGELKEENINEGNLNQI